MRQLVYCLLLSASPGVNSLCWWSFIEECSNVMSDKILTANLKTWRWDPDQTPLSWHEDQIYTVSPFLGTQVVTLSLCPPAQFSQYCFTMWHKIFARWICWLVSACLWSLSRYRQSPESHAWSQQPGQGPGQGWGHENPREECQAFWSPIVIRALTPLSRTKFDICFRSLFSEQ